MNSGYERQLVDSWMKPDPRMVHPFRMRSLARARGFEAKTDGLDASPVERVSHADAPRRKPDPERDELRDPAAAPASVGQPRNSTGWTKITKGRASTKRT